MPDTKKQEQKQPGHLHDVELSTLAHFFGEVRAINHDGSINPPTKGIATGNSELMFGVHGTEITVEIHTKGPGFSDTESITVGRIRDISSAEHIIRGLITLVKQAKKNQIDTPGLLGGGYTGIPLVDDDEANT